MLNRLIIAVFGLALVFALGSSALAGPGQVASYVDEPLEFNTNHPKLNEGIDIRPVQSSFKKPASAIVAAPEAVDATNLPSPAYFCDVQGYALFGPAYIWSLPDAYGDDLFNTRFTVETNFECTLKVAWLLMHGALMEGAADMRVYLWDDDGFGFPGIVLDSVDIPYADIAAATGLEGFGWLTADFSAGGWVFADGAEYHYGWTPLGGPGDVLWVGSDQAGGPHDGEERSSEFYNGAWGSMLNDWDVDVIFHIMSERCCEEIPFSDCYTQSYWTEVARIYRAPQPTYGDTSYTQRFSVGGPETLQSVDLYIYDLDDGEFGNDDVYVTIYDDNGFGQPGTQLAQVTLPAGTYPAFPSVSNAVFGSLVLQNSFHVGFSTSGVPGVNWEWILADLGESGTGRSNASGDPTWPGGTTWYSMLAWWGVDVNFMMEANLCRDEFADCLIQDYYAGGESPERYYPIPEPGNDNPKWAQKFTNEPGGSDCELRQLDLRFARHPDFDGSRPLMYTHNTFVRVAEDVGGKPGPIIHTEIVTPADYAAAGYTGSDFFGTFMITRNVNVVVPAAFWIIIEPDTPLREEGIRYPVNLFGTNGLVDGMATYHGGLFAPEGWYYTGNEWFGTAETGGMDLRAQVCCVPFTGAACAPPDLWTTQSHDFGRTGASNVAIEDAWCDLTTAWLYETPANSIPYMAPIVHDGRVYISTSDALSSSSNIEVLDLITGANLYTIADPDFGNFILNDPTIVNGILYISGGDARTITAWDISTTPATKVMSRSFGGAVGPLRFGNTIVLDIGGTEVVFAGSEVGRVVAINAATGADYAGWGGGPNPITLVAGQRIGGSASDGSSLFYVTRIGGLDGDVFSVDAATGLINWQLSTAPSGGLRGVAFHGESEAPQSEGFTNISYDAGKLFVGARMSGDHPRDGFYYTLTANSGDVINAVPSDGFIFSNPIVDVNLVYCQTITGWVGGTVGNGLFAAAKNTGGLVWISEQIYEGAHDGGYFGNGARSCEPEPVVDIIVNTDSEGGINFWNSITGEQLFRRQWDYGQDISDGASVTLASDATGASHVLVSNGFGAVVDLVKGADRPRLEIQDYDPELAVDFSVATSVIKTVVDGLVNTGCADLTFTNVNVSDVSNGSSDPHIVSTNVVRPDLLDRSTDLANQLASSSRYFKGDRATGVEFDVELSLVNFREPAQNNDRFISRSATSSHPYLNGVTQPVSGQVLAAGESMDIVIDVNPAEILRGPQIFYIELDTDDPDFYVNAGSAFLPSAFPEIKVTLIGGCLTDTTSLTFGIGDANTQIVWNTGTMSHNEAFGFDIDGEDAAMWLGSYIYGVSQRRLAMSFQYFGGDFTSWQADPNYCDNTCKPALITGVNLGAIWDGAGYSPIVGNMICVSGIDSVQDHDFGAGWNWENNPAPFSATDAMGLRLNSRTLAVPDVAELSQFTLEVFDFEERNGQQVLGWKFGYWVDYDIYYPGADSRDTSLLDPDHSVVWQAGVLASNGTAWGAVKVPFGCGYAPAKNVWLLDSDESFYKDDDIGAYLDQVYSYSSAAPGEYSMPNAVQTRDQSMHATLAEHDFAGFGTYSFGVAIFALHGLADAIGPPLQAPPEIAALANIANKWAGFGRGDVDNDNNITIADIMTVVGIVSGSVPGAIPFEHLADVDADGDVDAADVDYLVDYYFNNGPCPAGDWTL